MSNSYTNHFSQFNRRKKPTKYVGVQQTQDNPSGAPIENKDVTDETKNAENSGDLQQKADNGQ